MSNIKSWSNIRIQDLSVLVLTELQSLTLSTPSLVHYYWAWIWSLRPRTLPGYVVVCPTTIMHGVRMTTYWPMRGRQWDQLTNEISVNNATREDRLWNTLSWTHVRNAGWPEAMIGLKPPRDIHECAHCGLCKCALLLGPLRGGTSSIEPQVLTCSHYIPR